MSRPASTGESRAACAHGIAARPAPGRGIGATEVHVPPALLLEIGADSDDVLELRSSVGGSAYVRSAASDEDQRGDTARLVRIGRLLWAQLLLRPGDRVDVVRCASVATASSVIVRPAFHLSHHLGEAVGNRLRTDATLVWPRATLFVPVLPGGGGVILRVEEVDGSPAVIDGSTEVRFADPDPAIARRAITFAEVGGLQEAIDRLRSLVELPLLRPGLFRSLGVRAPKGVLLHGPPGTGKTLLSRAVAAELGVNVMKLPATELVGAYSGETEANLRNLFGEASHHAPTLIIIDEIDVIASSRRSLASQGDVRAATQLLSLMDGLEEVDGVVLLATTNRIEALDDAFRRPGRFDEEIYVGPPNAAARLDILAIQTREMPLTEEAEALIPGLAEHDTAGFTGADLMHLVREAGLFAARRAASTGSDRAQGFEIADRSEGSSFAVAADDFRSAVRRVSPSAARGLPSMDLALSWNEMDGLQEQKQILLEAATLALSGAGARVEGVLLAGPSGNGKTLLARALAHEVGANFVLVDGSSIFTQWLGESEAALRSMFQSAWNLEPAVVVLEHLDAIATRRGEKSSEHAARRVLSALLSSIDTSIRRGGVLVIGVTDLPESIDRSVTRAGRLGIYVDVPDPDADRRECIVTRRFGGTIEPVELSRIVAHSEGWSAAAIDRYADRASRVPLSTQSPAV